MLRKDTKLKNPPVQVRFTGLFNNIINPQSSVTNFCVIFMVQMTRSFTVYRSLPVYPVLLSLAIISGSCRKPPAGGEAEGLIRFNIAYNQDQVGAYSANVLPKQMTMEFGDGKVMNTIEGGLGFFCLVHVSDTRNMQHTTWLKFIDNRYIFEGKRKESPCCFGMLDGMKLIYTDSIKDIVGFPCLNAIASFPEGGIESFDIWYTEELGIRNPNSNTPFSDIPGVLLEFNTLMGNANMHMVATAYEARHIPPKQFQPPRNYKPVSKAEIEKILNALMN
jgi:hypothetical protein